MLEQIGHVVDADGTPSAEELAAGLLQRHRTHLALDLAIGRWRVRLESNSPVLIDRLRHYFRHFVRVEGAPDCVITAIESDEPDFGLRFLDWKREPGKTGRKDTYADVAGGRVIRKFRTGMQFLMAPDTKIAVGPCLANDNQVINFVNSQYIAWMLYQEWVLCHAAAVVARDDDGHGGLAIAGFSGGGKSTLALHLMSRGVSFVSNDRLLVRKHAQSTIMSGVPKLPRINPGTALNNPHLVNVLPSERRQALAETDRAELWDLEEKYDVEIDELFDGARFELVVPMSSFVVLNWERDSDDPVRVDLVELNERRDLLAAIMKSPGPFYKPPSRPWPAGKIDVEEGPYLDNLARVGVYEVSGRIDFDVAADACMDILERPGR